MMKDRASKVAFAVIAAVTLTIAAYQALASSDVYVSESRFLLRSAGQPAQPSFGSLFKGLELGGMTAEGPLMVKDYLLSREVMADLEETTHLRKGYRNGDLFSRFPAPFQQDSAEEFFDYYRQHIKLDVDPHSAVAVLTVRAPDPVLAQTVNVRMLALAETAVDAINRRMRDDTVKLAKNEVAAAEQRVANAESALAKFRRDNRLLDPERQAAGDFQMLVELQRSLINAEARLAQVRKLAPQSPQLGALEAQIASVRDAMARTRAQASGGDAKSLAGNSPAYQRLVLEREIAAKQLATTTEALLRARAEADRRQVYLVRLAKPSLPDSALEPRRARNVLAALIAGLLAWGVVALVIAGVREHGEVSG
jgi:capsular polysaccharide transport system permease protein